MDARLLHHTQIWKNWRHRLTQEASPTNNRSPETLFKRDKQNSSWSDICCQTAKTELKSKIGKLLQIVIQRTGIESTWSPWKSKWTRSKSPNVGVVILNMRTQMWYKAPFTSNMYSSRFSWNSWNEDCVQRLKYSV